MIHWRRTKMSIAANIKKLRKQNHMTQKQLAIKSGLAVITIQQYEAGKFNPKPDAVMKLCVGLNCKITDIIDDETKKYYRIFDAIDPHNKVNASTYISEIRKLIQRKENGESLTETEEERLSNFLEKQKETNEIIRMGKLSTRLHDITMQLNEKGQEKVIEHAEMIAKIPEYRKDEPPQE